MNLYPDIPADNDSSDENNWFKNGYDVLNDYRLAVRQIMEIDHYWQTADGGVHKQLTLRQQESDPSVTPGMSVFSKIHGGSGKPEPRVKATHDHPLDITMKGRVHYPAYIATNSTPRSKTVPPFTNSYVNLDEIIYCHPTFTVNEAFQAGHYLVFLRGPFTPSTFTVSGSGSFAFKLMTGGGMIIGMTSAWIPAGGVFAVGTESPFSAPTHTIIMALMRII